MNLANSPTNKKLSLMLFGFVLLLTIRQETLFASLRVNRAFVIFNQYPIWRTIVDESLPSNITLLPSDKLINHNNISLARVSGLLLFGQEQEAEAVSVWESAGLSPAKVLVIPGRYAQSVNDYETALAWYERSVELDPTLAEVWRVLGQLYQQQGEIAPAITAYEKALSLGDADSVDLFTKLLRDTGNYEVAIGVWQSALETYSTNPSRVRWWQALCSSLRITKEWDLAIKATQSALSEFPEDAQLHVERGFVLYHAVNDSKKAIIEFKKAIAIDENMAIAYAGIGELMAAEENYEAAVYWYNFAINRTSTNRSWYLARAEAAFAQEDLIEAMRFFEQTIRLWPDFAHAYYRLALVYRRADQPEKAVAAIEQAISLTDPTKPQYFFRAATIYEWIGKNEKALRAYQQVLILEPSNDLAKRGVIRLNNIIK